jgi:hypothetical protein
METITMNPEPDSKAKLWDHSYHLFKNICPKTESQTAERHPPFLTGRRKE